MGKRVLVAEGDSWFDYPTIGRGDILFWLGRDYQYDIYRTASYGDELSEMVNQFQDVCDHDEDCFCRCGECGLEQVLGEITEPLAILLSGGGNDFTGEEKDQSKDYDYKLERLLNQSGAATVLNQSQVRQVIDVELYGLYRQLIGEINATCESEYGKAVPIIIHGYDYVVPDGREWWGKGPWLKPAFEKKGYFPDDERNENEVLQRNTHTMARVLHKFNKMLFRLSGEIKNVHHLNLLGTLSNGRIPNVSTKEYERYWHNELHPHASEGRPGGNIEAGMRLIAAKFNIFLKVQLLSSQV